MYLRLIIVSLLFAQTAWSQQPGKPPQEFKLVVNESFGSDKLPKTIEPTAKGQWLISKDGNPGKALKYIGETETSGHDIKPVVLAFVNESLFNHFVLEADVEQCGRDYQCRDFCIVFDYVDENNYRFVHLASVTGELCHGVFEIKNGQLTLLTPEAEDPVIWGVKEWFGLRLERLPETNSLRFFMNQQLLWEISNLEGSGRIGFGGPDGAAKIDNLKIWAPMQ